MPRQSGRVWRLLSRSRGGFRPSRIGRSAGIMLVLRQGCRGLVVTILRLGYRSRLHRCQSGLTARRETKHQWNYGQDSTGLGRCGGCVCGSRQGLCRRSVPGLRQRRLHRYQVIDHRRLRDHGGDMSRKRYFCFLTISYRRKEAGRCGLDPRQRGCNHLG